MFASLNLKRKLEEALSSQDDVTPGEQAKLPITWLWDLGPGRCCCAPAAAAAGVGG